MNSNTCVIRDLKYDEIFKIENELLKSVSDEEITFRMLERDDHKIGFLDTLS